MHSRISIIVPVYNGEKTLDRCIQSLLAQTYPHFELLMADDGSTDRSREIIRRYAAGDSRVKLLEKPHSGVSATRNYALASATGDFIQFVDADDDVEADMLSVMLHLLLQEHADVAVCQYTHPCIRSYVGNRNFDLTDPADRREFYQQTFTVVVPWNKLYRREVITEGFPEGVGFCEDEMFFLANMPRIRKVAATDRQLYHYFVAPPDGGDSCITKTARMKDFWKTRDTYWFKRKALLPLSRQYLRVFLEGDDMETFAYTRIFDFMIWEILILNRLGADREGIVREIQAVFADPCFRHSLDIKRSCGIDCRIGEGMERDRQAEAFTREAMAMCDDPAVEEEGMNLYAVLLGLFARMFVRPVSGYACLNPADFLTRAYGNLLTAATPEARYVLDDLDTEEPCPAFFRNDGEAWTEECFPLSVFGQSFCPGSERDRVAAEGM